MWPKKDPSHQKISARTLKTLQQIKFFTPSMAQKLIVQKQNVCSCKLQNDLISEFLFEPSEVNIVSLHAILSSYIDVHFVPFIGLKTTSISMMEMLSLTSTCTTKNNRY